MPFDVHLGLPTDAVFSQDGRWVAYQTGQIGEGEAHEPFRPLAPNIK